MNEDTEVMRDMDLEENLDENSKSLRCVNLSTHHDSTMYVNKTTPTEWEYKEYQKYLGWIPIEVIKCAFAATTQFAAISFSPPLRGHCKSCFPALKQGMFCTDTWLGSTPAIGGYTCAQLYYGVKSKSLAIYPMIMESQRPDRDSTY